MKLTLKEKGTAYVLEISERVDAGDAESLGLFLAGLARRDARDLILDLSTTQAVVSAAIGTLLAQVGAFEEKGKKVVVLNPNEKVAAVLRRMGVFDALSVFRDVDSALAELGKGV